MARLLRSSWGRFGLGFLLGVFVVAAVAYAQNVPNLGAGSAVIVTDTGGHIANVGLNSKSLQDYPASPMTPQLPTTISAGASTSVGWGPLPVGSQIRITCTTASFPIQVRTGVGAQTAVLTDNTYYAGGACQDGSANCIGLTLFGSETNVALFSATGITCQGSLRNSP